MGDSGSTESDVDDSIAFRKCWSLGESFFYLERYYACFYKNNSSLYIKNYSKNENKGCPDEINPKLLRLYKSQLVALESICSELGIKDTRLNDFTSGMNDNLKKIKISPVNNDLKVKKYIVNFKFENPIDFEVDLESYLIGNLVGKDPRYDHIFRIAKHSMEFYRQTSLKEDLECKKSLNEDDFDYGYIISDLENIKNFVSRDKISVIQKIIDKWIKIVPNYCKYRNQGYELDKSEFDIIKHPALIEIVNRIRGLITGTLEVSDLLERQDRIIWAIFSFLFIIAIFSILGLIGYALCTILKLNPLAYYNSLAFKITDLAIIGGFIIGIIKSAKPIWQKWSDWITLKIALWRIENPHKLNFVLRFSGKSIKENFKSS